MVYRQIWTVKAMWSIKCDSALYSLKLFFVMHDRALMQNRRGYNYIGVSTHRSAQLTHVAFFTFVKRQPPSLRRDGQGLWQAVGQSDLLEQNQP